MFKFWKKKPDLKHVHNSPLLFSNSKGEKKLVRVKKIKKRIDLKKIKSLFNVNYNKSAMSCNPCMNACKQVDKKINGKELSNVNNKEMLEILKISVSS